MTKTQKTQTFLSFAASDIAKAIAHEFTESAGLTLTSSDGSELVGLAFEVEHISALEQLLNLLYEKRGDYDQQAANTQQAQLPEFLAA